MNRVLYDKEYLTTVKTTEFILTTECILVILLLSNVSITVQLRQLNHRRINIAAACT